MPLAHSGFVSFFPLLSIKAESLFLAIFILLHYSLGHRPNIRGRWDSNPRP
jgi:hypothetical protein